MSQEVGTGPGGTVVPDDLEDDLEEEAAALGNGADVPEEGVPEQSAMATGEEVPEVGAPEPAEMATGEEVPEGGASKPAEMRNGKGAVDDREAVTAAGKTGEDPDWTQIDRHADRVTGNLGNVVLQTAEKLEANVRVLMLESEDKLERRISAVLLSSDRNANTKFRETAFLIKGTLGLAGRERVAAAWRGPAEALLLLGGALNGIVERAGQDLVEDRELTKLLPVLRTAEDLLQRACQHEEGRLPVIDEELGTTGTHGARVEAVCRMVGDAAALAEKMLRGTESPGRKAIAVGIAGCVVGLGGVFGAEGENSEFVQRVERLRQERAGPVETAESNEVRAFRADFGKEVERLRRVMRWRERGVWAAGLVVCLLIGWGAGISGVDFSSVGRLL